MTEYSLPPDIAQQLAALPDDAKNKAREKHVQIDTALKEHYPRLSVAQIARVFGVSVTVVHKRLHTMQGR